MSYSCGLGEAVPDEYYDEIVSVVLQVDGVQLALEQGRVGLRFETGSMTPTQAAAVITAKLLEARPWRVKGGALTELGALATFTVISEIDRTCQLQIRSTRPAP